MPTNDDLVVVSWWLAPENARSREALAEHRPELAAWLVKVEEAVEARMGSFMMNFKSESDGKRSQIERSECC